jgi:UDP-arabinose 4-epimerase
MSTVLVTGGAGYVGAHVCKALAAAGHLPVAYDNLSRGVREAVQWGPLVEGDLRDTARLEAVLRHHRPAAVMHLAALTYIDESIAEPLPYYLVNVDGTASLLQAMVAAGVDRLVASGTCEVYGVQDAPLTEDAPAAPTSPYGHSKLMMERIIADAGAAHGLRWLSLRYFNAAGADPEGMTGERDAPGKRLIPNLLKVAAGRQAAFRINGADYPTADGTCVRDFVHVCDIAQAHVLALDMRADEAGPRILNLGTGAGTSIREAITVAERVSRRRIATVVAPRRSGDPALRLADSALARRTLGWAPRWRIDDMIAHAWSWTRSEATARRSQSA